MHFYARSTTHNTGLVTLHIVPNLGRYCNASARGAGPMFSSPARSAIVQANFKTR